MKLQLNPWTRRLAVLLVATALPALALAAEEAADKEHPPKAAEKEHDKAKDGDDKSEAIPSERSSITQHSATIGGRSIAYKATAGSLLIRDDENKPQASMFYVAYVADKGADAGKGASRPITFLFNGGPGSSSVWLHMGSVAPLRVDTASPAATPPAPYSLIANADSLLDKSDLVFVDAIGAGFSKPVGKASGKDFWGVDQDIKAFDKFIRRYLSVNQRWNSPKFVFGESYGTLRAAALAYSLQEHAVSLNGVVLLSSILNYGSRQPGLDNDYINTLPSFAAIAWYHDKIPQKPADMASFVEQARGFARGEYAAALAQGQRLPKAEEDAVAARLSGFTGLSVQYLEEANLRVTPSRFRKELLRGERATLGRYDARFEGIDTDAAGETPEYDASDSGIAGAFVASFQDYLARELKFTSEETYKPTNGEINKAWDWKHLMPGRERPLAQAYVGADLALAMRQNPHLKVLSANGYFDLATPFFATEYDLDHLQLEPALRDNLKFTYYPSGHMVYLNPQALQQFKRDLAAFYDAATAQ